MPQNAVSADSKTGAIADYLGRLQAARRVRDSTSKAIADAARAAIAAVESAEGQIAEGNRHLYRHRVGGHGYLRAMYRRVSSSAATLAGTTFFAWGWISDRDGSIREVSKVTTRELARRYPGGELASIRTIIAELRQANRRRAAAIHELERLWSTYQAWIPAHNDAHQRSLVALAETRRNRAMQQRTQNYRRLQQGIDNVDQRLRELDSDIDKLIAYVNTTDPRRHGVLTVSWTVSKTPSRQSLGPAGPYFGKVVRPRQGGRMVSRLRGKPDQRSLKAGYQGRRGQTLQPVIDQLNRYIAEYALLRTALHQSRRHWPKASEGEVQ